MRHFHKHSSFPLILILLSLGLIVFMFYSFTYEENQEQKSGQVTQEEVIPIDINQYRQDLSYIVRNFHDEYARATDDLAKLVVTESALEQMLDLIVPAEYKDLHLQLAVAFHQLEESLKSPNRSVSEAQTALDTLFGQYPWLVE